ncbi:MAG: aldolase/citrate lyase family protein, partial [Phycisphaerae bacterium]
ANQQTLLIAQIEHIQAVRNIQAILAVQGLDAIYVGPGDLSLSMGHPPSGDHPDVIQAIEQVFAAAKAASLPCGTLTAGHDELAFWLQRGGTLMTIGGDLWFLRDAADAALTAARQTIAARA